MKLTRREFLGSAAATAAMGAPRQPNLLFVFSDEHRACSMTDEAFNEAHIRIWNSSRGRG